jgi:hypothetical protein
LQEAIRKRQLRFRRTISLSNSIYRSVKTFAKAFRLGSDLEVNRLGFGAMRIVGDGVWGEPKDVENSKRVLKRALESGVNYIDTSDAYGPAVSERLTWRGAGVLSAGHG